MDNPDTNALPRLRKAAKLSFEVGDHDAAEAAYGALAIHHGHLPEGFVGLARIAERRQQWTVAAERWDDCIARFTPRPTWLNARAKALAKAGRHEDARLSFEELRRDHPDFVGGFTGLANLAFAEGDTRLALQLWEECFVLFPDQVQPSWRNMKALLFTDLGRLQVSDTLFRSLDADHPDLPYGILGLARNADTRRDKDAGDRLWADALRRFPENEQVLLALTRHLLVRGNLDEAERYIQQLRTRADPLIIALLEAEARFLRGRHSAALVMLRDATRTLDVSETDSIDV